MEDGMDTLAKRIKGRRSELGLSATDLAALAGISLPAVLKWESGQTANLKHEHFFLLADALNVRPRWLALGDGEKIASPAREAYRMALDYRDKAGNTRARRVWERLAATYAKAAMLLVLVIPPYMLPRTEAATLHNFNYANDLTITKVHMVHFVKHWLVCLRRFAVRFLTIPVGLRTAG